MPTRTALAALVIAMTACTRSPVRIDVTRGVPAESLAIRLVARDAGAEPPVVEAIALGAGPERDRGGRATFLWALAHQQGEPPLSLPAVIPYGTAPAGFMVGGPAPALPMGSYEVRATAGGVDAVTTFRVTEQNRIE